MFANANQGISAGGFEMPMFQDKHLKKYYKSLRYIVGSLWQDRTGNFGLMFAFCSVPLLIALGCSFDYVQALNTHRRMQSALDAALVAAVKEVGTKDTTALKSEIANWLEAESVQKGYYVLNTDAIAIDTTNSTIKAAVSATVPTTFLKIAGINNVAVAVESAVAGGKTVTKSAFSMHLVLDHSGSMGDSTTTTYTTTCYTNQKKKTGAYTCTKTYTKIEALKLAVGSLMGQLAAADPDLKYVRTAAVSYNDQMDTPTGFSWGEDQALTYVNNLQPAGMTDSSVAMATAYQALIDTTAGKDENKIHFAKNGVANPKKYIVFMTDGENTKWNGYTVVDNPEADASTKATCDAARKNNVTVYTIAFMAPARGQALLQYCATTADDYFAAESTAQLVDAFKSIGESSSDNLIRLTQ
jgi:Flp pilus assembly protein TadG